MRGLVPAAYRCGESATPRYVVFVADVTTTVPVVLAPGPSTKTTIRSAVPLVSPVVAIRVTFSFDAPVTSPVKPRNPVGVVPALTAEKVAACVQVRP